IDLRGDFIRNNNFQWSSSFNISGNRSRVLKISSDFSNPAVISDYGDAFTNALYLGNNIVREGQPLGLIYNYKFKGIIKTQQQLDEYKANSNHVLYTRHGVMTYLGIGDPMFEVMKDGPNKNSAY